MGEWIDIRSARLWDDEVFVSVPMSNELELERLAEQYTSLHGDDAYSLIGDEISSAVGMRKWDVAHLLQKIQWRVRKLERLRQLAAQMRFNQRSQTVAAAAW